MATFSSDLWGVYLTLTEAETKEIEAAADVGSAISAIVAAAAAVPPNLPLIALSGVLNLYLQLEKALVGAIDQGNGVTLCIPWIAIWNEQFWLIYPTPVSVTLQAHWRWCARCDALFFAGSGQTAGVCPTGGTHGPNGSSDYKLVMDVPGYAGQHNWRWCSQCSALHFGGVPGRCPATGAAHVSSPSSDYALVMDNPNFSGQHGWCYCGKCSGLFWVWKATSGGVCPAGGAHTQSGSSDYALMS